MPAESQLFTVRLWSAKAGDAERRWRGQVKHVTSGAWQYFRDWETLCAFLETSLQNHTPPGAPEGPSEPHQELP